MSTSRRMRRRNQSAEHRARRSAEQQAAQWAVRHEERPARLTEALTAADASIAAEFPDLHDEGLRLGWVDDEEADG